MVVIVDMLVMVIGSDHDNDNNNSGNDINIIKHNPSFSKIKNISYTTLKTKKNVFK